MASTPPIGPGDRDATLREVQARLGAPEALLPDEIRRNGTRTRIVVARDNDVPYGQDVRFSRGIPAGVVWDVRAGPRSELVRLIADGFGHGIPGRPAGAYGNGALAVRRVDLEAALAEGRAHRVP